MISYILNKFKTNKTKEFSDLEKEIDKGYIKFIKKTCEEMSSEGLSKKQVEKALSQLEVDIQYNIDEQGNVNLNFSWTEKK